MVLQSSGVNTRRLSLINSLKNKFKLGFVPGAEGQTSSKRVESFGHRDFVKTMTNDFTNGLEEAYEYNKEFSHHIAVKVNNLKRYEK